MLGPHRLLMNRALFHQVLEHLSTKTFPTRLTNGPLNGRYQQNSRARIESIGGSNRMALLIKTAIMDNFPF